MLISSSEKSGTSKQSQKSIFFIFSQISIVVLLLKELFAFRNSITSGVGCLITVGVVEFVFSNLVIISVSTNLEPNNFWIINVLPTSRWAVDTQGRTLVLFYTFPYVLCNCFSPRDHIKIWDNNRGDILVHMNNIIDEVLDMFLENEKIKKYTYPVMCVIICFNLLILLLLLLIIFMIRSER